MKLATLQRQRTPYEELPSTPLLEGCDHELRFSGRGAPIGNCERPTLLACMHCRGSLTARCNASARSICGPCGVTYRQRVGRIFASGWTDNPLERLYFLTLTAPSEVGGHTMPSGDICPCTPVDGINLAEWHADVGQRWSWFMTALRRAAGEVQYCKATEVQARGAVHFHALVRTDGQLSARVVRELAIRYGFGHAVDVQLLTGPKGAQKIAWYCAKYASKAADDRHDVDTLDQRTGEVVRGMPRLRVWTASRGWGLTMLALKASQARWARSTPQAATLLITTLRVTQPASFGSPLPTRNPVRRAYLSATASPPWFPGPTARVAAPTTGRPERTDPELATPIAARRRSRARAG